MVIFSMLVRKGPDARPACCAMGTGFFPRVKRSGHGADYPPLSSAKVENVLELYVRLSSLPA